MTLERNENEDAVELVAKRAVRAGNPEGYHAHSLADLNRASIASLQPVAPLASPAATLAPAEPAKAATAPESTPVAVPVPVPATVEATPVAPAPAAWGAK